MKCPKCGADIPEGKFYCEKCGEALQIVPDYNPAEDITIGEEDNNIQNKDSSDASSGEQRSDRKQRFFYMLKKYGPFALVLHCRNHYLLDLLSVYIPSGCSDRSGRGTGK